ncbi:hypothetical protein Rin_00011600, partial [Candidatus Regiella insecticola 5.15]
ETLVNDAQSRQTATFVAMRVHKDYTHRVTQDPRHSIDFENGLLFIDQESI